MNLTSNSLEAAIASEHVIRAGRFEALGQLLRQRSLLEPQIEVAELLLADSDRELGRLRQQLHRSKKS